MSNTMSSSDGNIIPSLQLPDGKHMPMLGYGLGTARKKSDSQAPLDESLIEMIVMAINAGYYHLDTAEVYNNERELGEAIRRAGVPREKLYVVTKISGEEVKDTEQAFRLSLERLRLSYVNLYLIHAPFFAETMADLQVKWRDLEKIHATGQARSIGVSNMSQRHLEAILETAKTPPAINQIEYHPYLQHGDLVKFHERHNIATSAYGPLTAVVKASPGPLDETYRRLAQKYAVTPNEVALNWVLAQGVAALTTSSSENRLKQYLCQFSLAADEIQDISDLGRQKHFRGCWLDWISPDDRE